MSDPRLPYFFVIGAMKAGTTSLHAYLDSHPQLSLPFTTKELNFFNSEDHWKQGVDWYKDNFRNNSLKKGEVCPNYSMFPACTNVPHRMHSILPNVKLVYILRDPVERMLSQVHHQWVAGRETRDINEIIADKADHSHYIAYSKYYYQLDQFLHFYPKECILIATAEMLRQDPQQVMQKIFSFLEVDADFHSEIFSQRRHVSELKVKPGGFLQAINQSPLGTLKSKLANLLPEAVYRGIREMMITTVSKPVITDPQRDQLVQTFCEDICQLKTFTGYSFKEWSHDYTIPAT